MKILLHICCGPCAIYPLKVLREEGCEVTGLFYNPNIHPYAEFEKRRLALASLGEIEHLPLIIDAAYPIEVYFAQVMSNLEERCLTCYRIRLDYTASMAHQLKFDAFTSTLLYSKYQKHEAIKEIGRSAAAKWGTEFVYRDFRGGWKEGIEKSKAMGLYRQKYCGCLFSEKERFWPKSRGS
ncbi:MAG TPA: epoxyqueuosine reductase QueH [Syntrophales bacterium]|nr:epoxyqueuosine reductase QueH [Syntrophales bacterium]HOL59547.1 epoxyqueuosine reductase QueH [Syntrophales bacterium]HPO35637.1 epoxyqueuosine reductase QueH [Syntrophales bacterium]